MRLAQLELTQFFPLLRHQAVEAVAELIRLEMLAALAEVVVVMQMVRLVGLESQVKEMQAVLAHLGKAAAAVAQALLAFLLLITQMLLVEQDCVQLLLDSACFMLAVVVVALTWMELNEVLGLVEVVGAVMARPTMALHQLLVLLELPILAVEVVQAQGILAELGMLEALAALAS